ncbi:MFS transporter [Melghirimyces algeriensis]|uniref:Predicted arabinose efflux permease, MFS family n=1 Tax=Melghirimyces algeriensis TaxID=910412 RepID=A0A521CBX2_9BACL|nr:MFS transporter [Melghirimyces algeriensis]SMO56929.1 Predicted arabinose efflux permease, MFS family [Melghirimyces algeriensis]
MEDGQTVFRTRFYYGWMIVLIAGLGVFFSAPGQTYSNSIFIDYYIHDFGWSRSLVSGIYSGATLFAGLLLILVGRMVDRFGQRAMMVGVGTLFAAACFWNSFVFTPIMLFIGFLTIRLLGQGSMTLIPNTLVPQWFIRKRGRALSLMMIGGFAGATFSPILNAWMIDRWDWPTAWRIWGILLLVVFVPLAAIFVRNRPEDVGMLPDQSGNSGRESGAVTLTQEEDWTLKEAMRTRTFWLILMCVSFPALVNTGLTFHLTSIMKDQGLGISTAALVLSLMAGIGFPTTFAAGFAVDRYAVHRVLAFVFLLQFVFLVLVLNVHSVTTAVLFAVFWGFCNGLEQIVLNAIWPQYFGRRYLGSIRGVAMTTTVISSALGPLPYGVAYDWFGGYTEVILATFAFPIVGFVAALSSTPPRKSPKSNQIVSPDLCQPGNKK